MALKLKSYVKKDEPFHLLLVGVSGSGKTTTCASLLRKSTLLLYTAKTEPHSPIYMSNGVSIFEGAKASNLFAVAIDLVEESDKGFLPFVDKMEVGASLNNDQALAKLKAYISFASSSGIISIVIDSWSGLFSILRGTQQFANLCKTDKGAHNSFKEAEAYLIMHEELNAMLIDCRNKGINTVSILGAKNIGVGTDLHAIQPDLPMFSVAEKLPFRYSDVLIVSTRDIEGAEDFRTILDFGLSMDKASKNQSGKIEKFISIKPRLSFVPPDLQISFLPPDLWKLREFVEAIKNAK